MSLPQSVYVLFIVAGKAWAACHDMDFDSICNFNSFADVAFARSKLRNLYA